MSGKPTKRVRLTGALPPHTAYCERFRCQQLTVGRELEFRLLGKDLTEADRIRFQKELFELSRADSPYLLPIFDSGATKGRPFYTVPLRHDPSVASLVEAERLELEDLAQVVRCVAGAMAALHVRVFAFSDPDPAMIAWDPLSGQAYMLHHHGGSPPGDEVVVPPDVRPGEGGPPADVFRWGRFAYRLLTGGSEPYPEPEALVALRERVPTLAPDLTHCIQASLEWDPAERPETGMVLQAVLQRSAQNVVPDAASVERIASLRSSIYLGKELERLTGSIRIQEVRAAHEVDLDEEAEAEGVEEGLLDDSSLDLPLAAMSGGRDPASGAAPAGSGMSMERMLLAMVVAIGLGVGLRLGGSGVSAGEAGDPGLPPPATVDAGPARPAPSAPPRLELTVLPPSKQAPYLRDPRVQVLLEAAPVTPRSFPALRKTARDLALAKRLPPAVNDVERIVELRKTFAADPARACADLQRIIEDLKKVLDYRPGP